MFIDGSVLENEQAGAGFVIPEFKTKKKKKKKKEEERNKEKETSTYERESLYLLQIWFRSKWFYHK